MEQPRVELMKRGLVMEEKKPVIGNQRTEEQQETPEKLQFMIAAYERHQKIAHGNKERLTDLLGRKSANKWNATKKAKMVRRYMRADQSITECSDALDQLRHRLSQITTAAGPNISSPFTPPVATSEG